MELSITTDYVKSDGDPSPYLKRIADTGFTHVHWCHQWNTDYLYAKPEIDQIQKWFTEYGLQLLDLHGSMVKDKNWASPREHERRAGVELVRNRLEMAAQLNSDTVIMHIPDDLENDAFRRSLDDLSKVSRERGVRIAVENTLNLQAVARLLPQYDAGFLGFCYDSGHGNMEEGGLEQAAPLMDRLLSVHLNDNDGRGDQHKPLFAGTVDWARLAQLIAASAYTQCVSMEILIHHSAIEDETDFLNHALTTGIKFSRMIENEKNNHRTKACGRPPNGRS